MLRWDSSFRLTSARNHSVSRTADRRGSRGGRWGGRPPLGRRGTIEDTLVNSIQAPVCHWAPSPGINPVSAPGRGALSRRAHVILLSVDDTSNKPPGVMLCRTTTWGRICAGWSPNNTRGGYRISPRGGRLVMDRCLNTIELRIVTLARTGGGGCNPLRFFADSEKKNGGAQRRLVSRSLMGQTLRIFW